MVTAAITIGAIGLLVGYLALGGYLQDRHFKKTVKRIDAMSQEEVDEFNRRHA